MTINDQVELVFDVDDWGKSRALVTCDPTATL